jgi:hypothetical protein
MTVSLIAPIVEGHGEVEAIRTLLTRVFLEVLELFAVVAVIEDGCGSLVRTALSPRGGARGPAGVTGEAVLAGVPRIVRDGRRG